MSHRSELAPSPIVTTLPNVFQVRKQQNRVRFGDLEDLRNVRDVNTDEHWQYRRFSNGNYSVSVLNYFDAKRVVVIHQENVDPSLVAARTMQPTDDAVSTVVSVSKKTVFRPSDWFSSRQASSSTDVWENQTRKKRRLDQPAGTSTVACMKFFWGSGEV